MRSRAPMDSYRWVKRSLKVPLLERATNAAFGFRSFLACFACQADLSLNRQDAKDAKLPRHALTSLFNGHEQTQRFGHAFYVVHPDDLGGVPARGLKDDAHRARAARLRRSGPPQDLVDEALPRRAQTDGAIAAPGFVQPGEQRQVVLLAFAEADARIERDRLRIDSGFRQRLE